MRQLLGVIIYNHSILFPGWVDTSSEAQKQTSDSAAGARLLSTKGALASNGRRRANWCSAGLVKVAAARGGGGMYRGNTSLPHTSLHPRPFLPSFFPAIQQICACEETEKLNVSDFSCDKD